jgi:hypothetical protein
MNFRQFLCLGHSAWNRASTIALNADRGFLDEAFDDWAQANWELLVERPLCGVGEFLEIYGSGSDYETQAYSRVFFHDATPTHSIVVRPSGAAPIDLLSDAALDLHAWTFERLVARVEGWFQDQPPFDHVLVTQGEKRALLALSSVRFECERGA